MAIIQLASAIIEEEEDKKEKSKRERLEEDIEAVANKIKSKH